MCPEVSVCHGKSKQIILNIKYHIWTKDFLGGVRESEWLLL